MNILITGNKGFIGTQVELMLNASGCHSIYGIDSMEPQVHGWKDGVPPPRSGYAWFPANCDTVIHLAAKVGVGESMYRPAAYVQCNTMDTAEFLARLAHAKPKRLIVASSMSIYGEGSVKWDTGAETSIPTSEESPPDLRSIYALTKYDQEQLCLIWGRAHDVPTVALRFFNVYGPGQALTNPYTGVMAIFASRLLNNKPPVIYENGQQTRDFFHVDDIARAVVHFATLENVEPGVYNVGTGKAKTIEAVARFMAFFLGKRNINPVITNQHRKGDIRHCYADITKIKATGWEPTIDFIYGIESYCKWLLAQPIPADKFEQAENELKAKGMLA